MNNKKRKLSDDDIEIIINKYRNTNITIKKLSFVTGVSLDVLYNILPIIDKYSKRIKYKNMIFQGKWKFAEYMQNTGMTTIKNIDTIVWKLNQKDEIDYCKFFNLTWKEIKIKQYDKRRNFK